MVRQFMQLSLIAASLLVFTGCDDDNDPVYGVEVAIADLASTGSDGYKVTATADGTDNLDFYFCTNHDGSGNIAYDGYDYIMYDAGTYTTPYTDTAADYGDVDYEGTLLGLYSETEGQWTDVETDGPTPGYLQEGHTYDYQMGIESGTIKIHTITDFDCSGGALPV
ncbi:hypothetical protein [Sulfurovum mangrovi]|uniref:hypothetical protein n=1 Tax=Sulfurovum mangrovi TaxID=2893889 RepID=UPI001E4A3632|nr:hypothetical protein [Sulfurovum mangrovi]UFH60114.1 hypothetical protein LN246_04530 [Sulfurovum mangrovi]